MSLSLPPTTTGVFITGVDPGSPAETAGLTAGPDPSEDASCKRSGGKTITSKADYAQAARGV